MPFHFPKIVFITNELLNSNHLWIENAIIERLDNLRQDKSPAEVFIRDAEMVDVKRPLRGNFSL